MNKYSCNVISRQSFLCNRRACNILSVSFKIHIFIPLFPFKICQWHRGLEEQEKSHGKPQTERVYQVQLTFTLALGWGTLIQHTPLASHPASVFSPIRYPGAKTPSINSSNNSQLGQISQSLSTCKLLLPDIMKHSTK